MAGFKMTVPLYASSEYLDAPTYAEVSFNKNTVEFIKKAVTVLKELEADSISRYDVIDRFFDEDFDAEKEGELKEVEFRTDLEELNVCKDTVMWKGCFKNASDTWHTEEISIKEILECWNVQTCPKEKLPLLINVKYGAAKKALKARLKGETSHA